MCNTYNPRVHAIMNRELDCSFLSTHIRGKRWWISHQFYIGKLTLEEYKEKMNEIDKEYESALIKIFDKYRIKPDEPNIFHE